MLVKGFDPRATVRAIEIRRNPKGINGFVSIMSNKGLTE